MGGQARWLGCAPAPTPRIYFANHTSHLDTLILWSALPPALRANTHPVAARDYWDKTPLRRLIAHKGLDAVLIERSGSLGREGDPLAEARLKNEAGHSLILFPEGTRGTGVLPAAFRAGLYNLARDCPNAELVPVYLANPARALPKGALLPAPITCTALLGAPIKLEAGERAPTSSPAPMPASARSPMENPVTYPMMNNPMPLLLGGLGGLLSFASITGFVLARGAQTDEGTRIIANLNARIRAWWVMVAMCGLAFVFGKGVTSGSVCTHLVPGLARVHFDHAHARGRSSCGGGGLLSVSSRCNTG